MFISYMDNDLDTPKALALIWEIVKDPTIAPEDKRATILDFDTVFGLGLGEIHEEIIPEEVTRLVEEREHARKEKEWQKSDDLRTQIESLGYEVKDTENGTKISKL